MAVTALDSAQTKLFEMVTEGAAAQVVPVYRKYFNESIGTVLLSFFAVWSLASNF
jgi:hypothetical protein